MTWYAKLFEVWKKLTKPIGWAVTNLLLTLVFVLLLVPIGLMMKVVGYDPLKRKLKPDRESYWEEAKADVDPGRYFKQY